MLLKAQRIDVQRFVLLRGPHVVEHRAGRNRRSVVSHQAVSFERAHTELALHERHRKVARPYPVFNARARRNLFQCRRQLGA